MQYLHDYAGGHDIKVCITDGTSTAVSSSGIQFPNNDDSGILPGNQGWVIKLLEIVESSPVPNTLHQAPPKNG